MCGGIKKGVTAHRAAPLVDSPTSCTKSTESKKHCHRRVAEHVSSLTLCLSKNLIARANSSSLEEWRAVFPVVIGNPSDPRRRAEAPVVTYSALSSRWRGLSVSDVRTCPTPYALDALAQPSNRILAPQRSWAGHTEAAVTASRFSHGSSAACQAIFQIFKDR